MEEIRSEKETDCNQKRKRGSPRKKPVEEVKEEVREMECHQKRKRGRPRKNPVEAVKKESNDSVAADNGGNTVALLQLSQQKLPLTLLQVSSSADISPNLGLHYLTRNTKAYLDRCIEISASLRSPVQNISCARIGTVLDANQQHSVAETIRRQEVPVNDPLQAKMKRGETAQRETAQVSRTVSLNLMQIVDLISNKFQDDEEIESRPSDGYVLVHGYSVRDHVARMLEKIVQKHGDIAGKSNSQSVKYCSHLLETVCGICQKLEASNILEITNDELVCMLEQVKHVKEKNVEVGWLQCRLDEILETRQFLKGLKERKARTAQTVERCSKAIEGFKKKMEALLVRIQEEEEALARAKVEDQKLNEKFASLKPKMDFMKNLAHQLL